MIFGRLLWGSSQPYKRCPVPYRAPPVKDQPGVEGIKVPFTGPHSIATRKSNGNRRKTEIPKLISQVLPRLPSFSITSASVCVCACVPSTPCRTGAHSYPPTRCISGGEREPTSVTRCCLLDLLKRADTGENAYPSLPSINHCTAVGC